MWNLMGGVALLVGHDDKCQFWILLKGEWWSLET